jgi:hypothetical protein
MIALLAERAWSLIIEGPRAVTKAFALWEPRGPPQLTRQRVAHARQLSKQGESLECLAVIFRVSHGPVYAEPSATRRTRNYRIRTDDT